MRQTVAAFLRGGTTGLVLKGGLSLANALFSLLAGRKRRPVVLRQEVVSAARTGLFLATYSSGCRLTEGLLKARFGSRSDSWRAAVAGAAAAPTLLLASSQCEPCARDSYTHPCSIQALSVALNLHCTSCSAACPACGGCAKAAAAQRASGPGAAEPWLCADHVRHRIRVAARVGVCPIHARPRLCVPPHCSYPSYAAR